MGSDSANKRTPEPDQPGDDNPLLGARQKGPPYPGMHDIALANRLCAGRLLGINNLEEAVNALRSMVLSGEPNADCMEPSKFEKRVSDAIASMILDLQKFR